MEAVVTLILFDEKKFFVMDSVLSIEECSAILAAQLEDPVGICVLVLVSSLRS